MASPKSSFRLFCEATRAGRISGMDLGNTGTFRFGVENVSTFAFGDSSTFLYIFHFLSSSSYRLLSSPRLSLGPRKRNPPILREKLNLESIFFCSTGLRYISRLRQLMR